MDPLGIDPWGNGGNEDLPERVAPVTDTQWADVSEWQCVVNDQYPYPVLSIRCSDGTYRDKHFAANYDWSWCALDSGRLKALIVYTVFRPNWRDTLNTVMSMVGDPHPKMAMMIDVESWGGQIRGDQSGGINSLYYGLTAWLGDARRVIGYGNIGDLNTLWPNKPPGLRLVIAAYGSNPNYSGKLAHQYADNVDTPPFGRADINSADGMAPDDFAATLGLTGARPGGPPPSPPATPSGGSTIPPMNYGQTSDEIRHLQSFMNATFPDYSRLPVTGYYGNMTQAVVREFQQRADIIGGDGANVGPRTCAKLYEYGFRG